MEAAIAAIAADEEIFTEMATAVVASTGKKDEYTVHFASESAQLTKDRKEVTKVTDKLHCYRTEMSTNEEGEHNLDHID